MAITSGDLQLWRALRDDGHLPLAPSVLEIGQANWFGDAPLPEGAPDEPFAAAKWFYQQTLGYSRIVAIDMDGTAEAHRADLNKPLRKQLPFELGLFDVVINTGTIEHCFNVAQVFQSIHEHCKPGGLMVHSFPVAGWLDHGFFTFQPCLLEDLAFANRYEQLAHVVTEMEQGTQCHLCWRKVGGEPFKFPMQRRG